ncbi:uncharacterized protein EV420DRAFT_801522 [Desarmillaria tabescens]|uniref:Uncharacterized protein n=1 Tax=Armillaria tabescens TaxID=1929756 RepID=A0AA39NI77_ARMTA|nr:uncharacterized protein EV420DRAFT_801522 [Desarmillaria tabescens]KAK0465923.1 hypothetical protein EV420DRAFT_801522 [Desarmillaria tabescens]
MSTTTIQDDYDHLYTCLESDTLPPVPTVTHSFQDPETSWPEEPKMFMYRAWASNAMPYQGFLPAKLADFFCGDLFKPLEYGMSDLPLVCLGPGQWGLDKKMVEEWATLEELLLCFRDILAGQIVRQRSLGHCSFPSPHRYGYHHTKTTKKAMRRAAARSRDAFIFMAAEISYLLALASAEIGGYNLNSWNTLLTETVGSGWAALVRHSWLVQHDIGYWAQRESTSRRVGIFVDPRKCNFAYFLKAYLAFGVPVWIDWGPLINPFPACDPELQTTYKFLLPPKHIRPRVKALSHFAEGTYVLEKHRWQWKFCDEMFDLEWNKVGSLALPRKVSRIYPSDDDDEEKINYEPASMNSTPHVSPRQRLGETWVDFFSRLEKETELMMQYESPRDVRRRETRDSNARRRCYPERMANVFVWNAVDGKDYLVRCHVPHDRVADLWDFYISSQRRYSSFWDEWDLNHEFDPSALQDAEEEEEIHESDNIPGPSVGPELLRPVKSNREAWEAAYIETFKPKLQGMTPTQRDCMSLEAVVRYRLGIVLASSPLPETILTAVEKAQVDKGLRLMGCDSAARDEHSPLSSRAILTLMDGFQWLREIRSPGAKPYIGQIPREAWDVSLKCSQRLQREHQHLTVVAVESWDTSIAGYEIQMKGGNETSYKLILPRAADVLYVFRLPFVLCLDDIVEDLCSHGIPFILGQIVDRDMPFSKPKLPPVPPLYRPSRFVPDVDDFKMYLWRRGTLFSNLSVVRAALMCGGIIWRIALDHIGDPSLVLSAFDKSGPCDKNITRWKPNLSHKEPWVTWTETLSSSEEDIICGVYNIERSNNRPTQVSWFPKMKAFRDSGLDLGFWSADAERWYINRVKMYASGDPKARCQGHSDWRRNLRLWIGASQLYEGMEIVSRRFVDRHFISH